MILAKIGKFECSTITEDSYGAVFEFMHPVICTNAHANTLRLEKEALYRYIEYYSEHLTGIMVTSGKDIVGVYLGDGGKILHIVSSGGFESLILLLHVGVNELYDSSKPSWFNLGTGFSNSDFLARFCKHVQASTYMLTVEAKQMIIKAWQHLGGELYE